MPRSTRASWTWFIVFVWNFPKGCFSILHTTTCILSLSFSDWFGIKAAISNDVLELLSETFKLWSHCVYYFLFTIISYHCNIGVVKFDQFLILRRKNAVVANAILPKFQDSSQSCTYDLKIENVKSRIFSRNFLIMMFLITLYNNNIIFQKMKSMPQKCVLFCCPLNSTNGMI